MPDWVIPILQTVGSGVLLAIMVAVPKVWVDTRQNTKDIEKHEAKFKTLFDKIDRVAENVAYIRGKVDPNG